MVSKADFMKRKHLLPALVISLFSGCSTTEVVPVPVPTPEPPAYVHAPHPVGSSEAELRAIFMDRNAPTPDALKDCQAEHAKLLTATASIDERRQGIRELIKRDPLRYHWCFYSKVQELHEKLASADYIDEKQKAVLEAYAFLTPVARAFLSEFKDSRYLRWAVRDYKRLSERVFYRKMDASPQLTAELLEGSNPFGNWRDPASDVTATPSPSPKTVLEKYGFAEPSPSSPDVPAPPPEPDPSAAMPPPPQPEAPKTLPPQPETPQPDPSGSEPALPPLPAVEP